MKKLEFDRGGRPVNNEDFQTLQNELSEAIFAPFAGRGAFIVSGCQVSAAPGNTWNVAAGLVVLDGEMRRFRGAASVALPAQFQLGAFDFVDARPYQTGGTKPCIRERPALLVAPNPAYAAGEFLLLDTWGGLRLRDLERAAARSLGEVQQLAALVTVEYDTTGRGRPGTAAWGWALANGQNGTADLRGMFLLGHNPDRGNDGRGGNLTANAVGGGGGAETHRLSLAEMPRHSHTYTDRYTIERDAIDAGSNSRRDQDTTETKTTSIAGGDLAHNNMPPYYVLAMRQWVGL